MRETLEEAINELKRVDHLIHVSLKYTRTVDVLLSVLRRFIECIDFTMDSLFVKAKHEGRLDSIPDSPVGKANKIRGLYDDPIIKEVMDIYLLFRRLVRAEYSSRKEFRRYVTMTVNDNGTIVEIDIDKVVEYYRLISGYLDYLLKMSKQNA